MGRGPTKAADNALCKARLEAAKYNERLRSKDGASELLGISVSTLSDYELGITKPSPEMAIKMADLYNSPELKNIYCREYCPLGRDLPEVLDETLDRIAVKAMCSLSSVSTIKDTLLEIVKDGVIDEDEKEPLADIIKSLDEITAVAMQIKNYAEKYLEL